jgi:hypothetical protein
MSSALVLGAHRHLDAEQALRRQREAEVVEQWRQVVHPVGEGDALLPGVRLERLLEARVQEADVRPALAHHLAVELQHQAQHAVRAGVLRAHVQLHGVVVELDDVDGVVGDVDAEQVAAAVEGCRLRVAPQVGAAERRQHRHQRDDPGMSRGRSAAGSAHSRLWVKAIGSPKLT